jgi:hypothetical protein
MINENITRCESCGAWTYLNEVDRLMGEPHICPFCKDKAKGINRAS